MIAKIFGRCHSGLANMWTSMKTVNDDHFKSSNIVGDDYFSDKTY